MAITRRLPSWLAPVSRCTPASNVQAGSRTMPKNTSMLNLDSPARECALMVAVAAWIVIPRTTPNAKVRPIYDSGTAGLAHVLGRLQTTASVLHTGAHPDDEDSAFVARTARGDHARVAYLSLTRGEGGQNIIGPE